MKDGDVIKVHYAENEDDSVCLSFNEDELIEKFIHFIEAQIDSVFEDAKPIKAEISIMELGFALQAIKNRIGYTNDKWLEAKKKELLGEE